MISALQICRRSLPVNLVEEDLSLFAHDLTYRPPEVVLERLQGFTVSPSGVIYRGLRVSPDSFLYPQSVRRLKTIRSRLKHSVLNLRDRYRTPAIDRALIFADDFSEAYFHWMADALPRLLVALDHGWSPSDPVLLPERLKGVNFVVESLRAFGLSDIRYLHSSQRCKELMVPAHTSESGHYNDELIRRVRDRLLTFFAGTREPFGTDRIYVSRSKAPRRKIHNEEAMVKVMERNGFRKVELEDLGFGEQIRLISQARFLVSNHGAGLTNMMFLGPGAKILEIRKRGDSHNNCYFTMASAVQRDYFYLACPATDSDEDAFSANLLVDEHGLEAALGAMTDG